MQSLYLVLINGPKIVKVFSHREKYNIQTNLITTPYESNILELFDSDAI